MPSKNKAGACGCCGDTCVELEVDGNADQTDKWSKTTDPYGVVAVTILEPVPLGNFMLEFYITQGPLMSIFNSSEQADFDGVIRVYVLEDSADDNADAVATLEINVENLLPAGSTGTFDDSIADVDATRMWMYNNEVGSVAPGAVCDGSFVSTDYGIFSTSFVGRPQHQITNVDVELQPFFFMSYDQKFVFSQDTISLIPQMLTVSSAQAVASVTDMSRRLIFERASDSDTPVYLRYEVEGDYNLDESEVKFNLYTSNDVGDISCRTGTSYYDEEPLEGNCTDPLTDCFNFPSQRILFAEADFDMDFDADNPINIDFTLVKSFWLNQETGSGAYAFVSETRCARRANAVLSVPSLGLVTYSLIAWMDCSGTTPQLHARMDLASSQGSFLAVWVIDVPLSAEAPSDVPTTVLNEANSSTWNETGYTVTGDITLNP